MPHTLTAQIETLIFLASALFALWKGQRYERGVAVVLLVGLILIPLVQDHVHYQDPNGHFYWVDVPELVVLCWLAVRTGAAWIIIEAAFQLLCVLTEGVHTYAHQVIGPTTYITLIVFWSFGNFLTLLAATIVAMRRRAREAAD